MPYHIYTTDGIILKRTPFGEANVLLHILTADLGLIMASARSARLSVSKLRPALQEFECVTLSCVKGKSGWKITNVVEKGSFYYGFPEYSHKTVAQIASILLQMIVGEVPHREIFQTIKSGFEFMREITEGSISSFEILSVLRVLFLLGYVDKNSDTEVFLQDISLWSMSLLEEIMKNKIKIVGVINKALQESHL